MKTLDASAEAASASFAPKTEEAKAQAACPVCGKKPPSTDPIPEGWIWDCVAADEHWLWCPEHTF